MSSFTFVHAADLHLDSPLLGLAGKSSDYAARVEAASREAFDNLIKLAIDGQCRFMLLAGDIFDGDLRNFQTGLYFIEGMRRLGAAGINVYMVLGNHDSENRFAEKLSLTDNVHVFPKAKPATHLIEDLGVAIHGQSFPRPDVSEDLARGYPPALSGAFNIGVLHTACAGSEGHHARYAPCTPEQLANHGYDYWALGHVHAHAILSEYPHIVYPGNLQGRHPRETGPKGAVLVTVDEGRLAGLEHRALDVVRWATLRVDASGVEEERDLLDLIRTELAACLVDAGGRPVALRLSIVGTSPLHARMILGRSRFRDDIETLLATLSHDIWLEKLKLETQPPAATEAIDPTVAGRLDRELVRLSKDKALDAVLESRLVEIRAKLPAGAHADAFIEQMRAEMPERAATLARSLVSEADHAPD
ncbi:DNA repair exonuclease [Sphingopyxis sp. OPL5]|uniref:metallophosphoesterase family protein n=1 Tax=Sphingopyxis sp. OPL5 TaxID=2486273 RepID=UPI00164E729C|nr:DNA repair exonuclease [Sphingopyxis sp. OPL5]QNO27846.1 DNA repair exonuclease [Sphingopyxis sp. OPL5]